MLPPLRDQSTHLQERTVSKGQTIETREHCSAYFYQNIMTSERFKNQPTILKRPTPPTKTRQLNQLLQRNRLDTRTLLTTTNKQPQLSHPTSPQGNSTKQA